MTTITYTDKGVTIDGHAGNPVVCHGISAISQMVGNYVEDKGWGSVSRGDGHLEIQDTGQKHFGCDLFCAMVTAFEDIAREYPENVKIIYEI